MLVIPAYAKINLALEVLARRPDGFHDLDMVTTTIDWHDLVSIEMSEAGRTTINLSLEGPACAGVPGDQRNLAVAAARAICDLSRSRWSVELRVRKSIPSGAGLGGGSADAAAVLRGGAAILAKHGQVVSPESLHEVALQLGSDVPLVLRGGAARVGGRGERIEPITRGAAHLYMVVCVLAANSTAAVYGALDDPHADGRAGRVAQMLAAGDPVGAEDLGSALEAPARSANPEFAASLDRLRAQTAVLGLTWEVTGSGGAVFAICTGPGQAAGQSQELSRRGWQVRACRSVELNPV